MEFQFSAPVIEWRGPAPLYYADIAVEDSEDVKDVKDAAKGMEYWGQVPVVVRIGDTDFTTALFPKDRRYLVSLRNNVRRAEGELGMTLEVGMSRNRDGTRPDVTRRNSGEESSGPLRLAAGTVEHVVLDGNGRGSARAQSTMLSGLTVTSTSGLLR